MARIDIKGFNSDRLLREIEKSVKDDFQKHPEKVLNSHVGRKIKSTCSKCGDSIIEILKNGKARCTQCGLLADVNLTITFK